jgi:hypothetical protein
MSVTVEKIPGGFRVKKGFLEKSGIRNNYRIELYKDTKKFQAERSLKT